MYGSCISGDMTNVKNQLEQLGIKVYANDTDEKHNTYSIDGYYLAHNVSVKEKYKNKTIPPNIFNRLKELCIKYYEPHVSYIELNKQGMAGNFIKKHFGDNYMPISELLKFLNDCKISIGEFSNLFINYKISGIFRTWWDDQVVCEETFYTNGIKTKEIYYKIRGKYRITFYKNNKIHGEQMFYNKHGKLKYIHLWEKGEFLSSSTWKSYNTTLETFKKRENNENIAN